MFGLFQKKESQDPFALLNACQQKRDWTGLARAYYQLGKAAMEQGDQNRAVLWLHRADTLYSAWDEVYEAVGEALTEDCSERIGALEEEAALLYNRIPAEVEERAAELKDLPVRLWGLLSMARLARLGEQLSRLPGCQGLGQLGWAADTMLKSFQTPISQEEYRQLMELCNDLYELGDRPAFFSGEIEVSGGAPFQAFDLNGMMGILELNGYLDNHLRLLSALSQGEEPPAAETGLVGCTLLPDYYVRTLDCRPEEVPQVQAELARIWSDFDFLQSGPNWAEIAGRLEHYQTLDLLQP